MWAVYACIHALETSRDKSYQALAQDWQHWFNYAASTVDKIFYVGDGHVCAVTKIADQTLPINHPNQKYQCENPNYLDDPYEGELFTYFIQLFSKLSDAEKSKLWVAKRAKLVSVEYTMYKAGPITVEQGYWFSAHELWKTLASLRV